MMLMEMAVVQTVKLNKDTIDLQLMIPCQAHVWESVEMEWW